jgi:hypothetical protein
MEPHSKPDLAEKQKRKNTDAAADKKKSPRLRCRHDLRALLTVDDLCAQAP